MWAWKEGGKDDDLEVNDTEENEDDDKVLSSKLQYTMQLFIEYKE